MLQDNLTCTKKKPKTHNQLMDNCCDCSTKELILVGFGLKAACSLIEQGKKRTGAIQMGSIYSEPAVLYKFAAFVCTPQKLPHVCSSVTKSCSWLQELLRDSNTSRFYFHLEVRKGQVLWMKRVLPPPFFFFFASRRRAGSRHESSVFQHISHEVCNPLFSCPYETSQDAAVCC